MTDWMLDRIMDRCEERSLREPEYDCEPEVSLRDDECEDEYGYDY